MVLPILRTFHIEKDLSDLMVQLTTSLNIERNQTLHLQLLFKTLKGVVIKNGIKYSSQT